ncbi:hypothetical protein SNEBB_005400 [Seison nebaliae]|nr:hypothetical protein SNEBB_005400 [Seison nebaliae]
MNASLLHLALSRGDIDAAVNFSGNETYYGITFGRILYHVLLNNNLVVATGTLFEYLSPILLIISIALNTLCFIIFTRPRMRCSSSSIFTAALALADALALTFSTLFAKRLGTLMTQKSNDLVATLECKLITYLNDVFIITSIWIVVVMMIERCTAVWMPLKVTDWSTPKRAAIICNCILLASCVVSSPVLWLVRIERDRMEKTQKLDFIYTILTHNETNITDTTSEYSKCTSSGYSYQMYQYVRNVVFFSFVPFLVLLVTNILIGIGLKKGVSYDYNISYKIRMRKMLQSILSEIHHYLLYICCRNKLSYEQRKWKRKQMRHFVELKPLSKSNDSLLSDSTFKLTSEQVTSDQVCNKRKKRYRQRRHCNFRIRFYHYGVVEQRFDEHLLQLSSREMGKSNMFSYKLKENQSDTRIYRSMSKFEKNNLSVRTMAIHKKYELIKKFHKNISRIDMRANFHRRRTVSENASSAYPVEDKNQSSSVFLSNEENHLKNLTVKKNNSVSNTLKKLPANHCYSFMKQYDIVSRCRNQMDINVEQTSNNLPNNGRFSRNLNLNYKKRTMAIYPIKLIDHELIWKKHFLKKSVTPTKRSCRKKRKSESHKSKNKVMRKKMSSYVYRRKSEPLNSDTAPQSGATIDHITLPKKLTFKLVRSSSKQIITIFYYRIHIIQNHTVHLNKS